LTLLHPWAIALGVAAAMLPVLIHWLTRPRPVRLPLSTIRFVQEAIRQRRARRRLRDWLVLALRTLAVLLLAWAVARPLVVGQPLMSAGDSEQIVRVVILDVSHSMSAVGNGVQLFERARSVAAGYFNDQAGLQANLILAAATPRPMFARLSTNFGALREELAHCQPLPQRLLVQPALNAAADLLAQSGGDFSRRREVIVVSDFQRNNWAMADFSVLPEDTHIQLDSVAPAEPLPNLAILSVASHGRVEQRREVRLEVEVGNFSSTPRQVRVDVTWGSASYQLAGLCGPWGKSTLSTELTPPGTGWLAGSARLIDVQDALAGDDTRPFALEVRPAPIYGLMTRQPAERRPSSSYFLERALVPVSPAAGRGGSKVVRLDPRHLDREELAAAELLVLDHPGKLSDDAIKLLVAGLRRGRGLLYVAAEAEDAVNLKRLAETAGSELQMPVEFSPAPASQRRRELFLTEVRSNQVPFTVFGHGLSSVTGALRFSGGLASRRLDRGLADDVLATYNDRSACMVVASCGAGTLAVLNADLSTSNLPSSPAFVPLIGELTGRLLGTQRAGEAAFCGEPLSVFLPTAAGAATSLTVLGPNSESSGELVEEGGGVLWRSPGLAAPGVYQVKRGEQVVFAAAAVIPPTESDLRPLEPGVFQGRLAGGWRIHFRAAAHDEERPDDLWVWLAVACLGCVLSEMLVLKACRC
jgi:Aerotolerance regulator N-terminal/von Willebrand factor type A domain